MLRKTIATAIACSLLHVAVSDAWARAAQSSSQSASKDDRLAEHIKQKVQDLGVSARITVILKNGNELYGGVSAIDDDTFQILEVDQRRLITIGYKDVKKVRYSYGNPNPFNGKRWNPIWGRVAAIGVLVLFVVVVPLSIPKT
jgi:hypothetical protein